MSLFSRSQPIAIPAGRVPHLISTPEMTLPLQPESHLQLRLRDDLDYGSAKSLSHLPFEALASASDVHDTHPPASAFTFAAPSRAPPARPLPKTETTFENVKQPRDTQRRSDNSSSSEAASSDTSSFMRDKIAGLCSAQYYKGSSEESDVRASDEAVYEWEPTLNDNLMSAQDRKAEAELQYFFSMMHVDDKHDSRIRKRHSSGHSTVEACRMDKLANLTTDLTMHQSKRRREGRVRFALEGVDMQLPGSSSPYISPENPAVQILLPRIRPTSFPPRPPTPADDDVESMNVESSGTDTYKEATMLNPLDFNLALDQSEHESDQLDDAPKVPEHTSGAGDSVARRSLDRIKAPSKERRSRGSDSIETEFEELKDGGVKSVKAIVMDGLRGPKCAKNGAYWHFPNSSLLEVFPEDDEYAPASWGWDTRSMEVKKRAEPESDMLSKVLSSNGPSHESRTKSFAPQRRFADGSLD
ncbi:hypothetical protein FH972_021810 [Carpinus fangiana]|uniref:Uncharacterized protein n=1 Tax=Carpinus fangiana TaxID=176857 RepID=A0A5N6KQD5_9ROSI|nr:hypothetical protein FH972_021810 [Carpinus fangiana]